MSGLVVRRDNDYEVIVEYDGKVITHHRGGYEPAWDWVRRIIEEAYALGLQDGAVNGA
jgi:hypothetical protein